MFQFGNLPRIYWVQRCKHIIRSEPFPETMYWVQIVNSLSDLGSFQNYWMQGCKLVIICCTFPETIGCNVCSLFFKFRKIPEATGMHGCKLSFNCGTSLGTTGCKVVKQFSIVGPLQEPLGARLQIHFQMWDLSMNYWVQCCKLVIRFGAFPFGRSRQRQRHVPGYSHPPVPNAPRRKTHHEAGILT